MRPHVVVLLALLGLGGCKEKPAGPWAQRADGAQARTQIYVLVDLSATWLNEPARARNLQVLSELGYGLAEASEDLPQPLVVQHRVIGANSLERLPLCDVVYRRMLAPVANRPDYEINKLSKLSRYLGADCPASIIDREPENLTEVSAAVISVANQHAQPEVRRYIIVVSDFLEEASAPVTLPSRLDGFRMLMIYRPVTEDLPHPASMTGRVSDWRAEFVKRGAEVIAIPDTALKRASVASYITAR